MLTAIVATIVGFSTRRPWQVIGIAAVLGLTGLLYAATHFAIDTDTEKLLPNHLKWRQNEQAYAAEFPQNEILVVIEAPTPELAQMASDRLAAELQQDHANFASVRRPQGGEFLTRASLLYPPLDQVTGAVRGLREAQSVIAWLAADPSLRGAMQSLVGGVGAAEAHRFPADGLLRPITMLSATLVDVFAGRLASFSWRTLMDPGAASPDQLRQFIVIDPKLDFNTMRPGHAPIEAIRQAAERVGVAPAFGATARLTGRVPIDDEKFAALSADAIPQLAGTVVAVLILLWLALRSTRIIGAVFATLFAGFLLTAATGLLLAGAFNLISIAFAVLFVGLGADFGIQFSVRYRSERHDLDEVRTALRSAAKKAGGPLALAAAGTTVGFFCFLPTDYRGIAELGLIAGFGMMIAFLGTITLLPALLTVLNPSGEPERMGFTWLAPADRFLARHRIGVVVGTLIVVLAGTPLLSRMHFDFDPMHLQDPNSEAVKTYRDLSGVPELAMDAVNLLVPSVADIPAAEKRVAGLPALATTRSVEDLVPRDQEPKLAAIRTASAALAPALGPTATRPAPSDPENVVAVRAAAAALRRFAATEGGTVAGEATRLSGLLDQLAEADAGTRRAAQDALVVPLKLDLARLRQMLNPEPVTVQSLPPELERDWVAPDGRARIALLAKGDPNDTATLRQIATEALAVEPNATGTPIELILSERLVVRAFVEAGIFAVIAIGAILWIALRRFGDVLLTLVPLLVAAAVTLEVMVLIGQPMNFANVIALPLLLGVGVAFKIYYIMAWRGGHTNLLQSTLTRAVFYSALTTATAFGSLWLSRQPGMSSMGKLMAVALMCTLAAAVLFQPALMGPPRAKPRPLVDEGAEEPSYRVPGRNPKRETLPG